MLNKEGVPSPAGQKWNTARIAKLIRNPVYRGAIVWNRHTMKASSAGPGTFVRAQTDFL
jgi:hypothetical protein